jgi:hypothetical protein
MIGTSDEMLKHINPDVAQFSIESDVDGIAAWTEIDSGRYMPRRIRGSFQGRALG